MKRVIQSPAFHNVEMTRIAGAGRALDQQGGAAAAQASAGAVLEGERRLGAARRCRRRATPRGSRRAMRSERE